MQLQQHFVPSSCHIYLTLYHLHVTLTINHILHCVSIYICMQTHPISSTMKCRVPSVEVIAPRVQVHFTTHCKSQGRSSQKHFLCELSDVDKGVVLPFFGYIVRSFLFQQPVVYVADARSVYRHQSRLGEHML